MADRDRSKFLLSKEALPKVVVPRAAPRKKREFRLPAAMQPGQAAAGPVPSKEGEAILDERAAGRQAAREKLGTASGEAAARSAIATERASGVLHGGVACEEPAAAIEPAQGKARGKRADSTLRFRDRTLAWFRAGDDLANEEESDEYESDEGVTGNKLPLLLVAFLLLALGIVLVAWWLA